MLRAELLNPDLLSESVLVGSSIVLLVSLLLIVATALTQT